MKHSSSTQRERARTLRKVSPDAELRFWRLLRNRHFGGLKFRRQHPLAGYIVDFVCLEKGLVIELDGGQHADQVEYDAERTYKLQGAGFRVIRFWDNDVLARPEAVLQKLYKELSCPSP